MSRTKLSASSIRRTARGKPKRGKSSSPGRVSRAICSIHSVRGRRWRIVPLGVSRSTGPKRVSSSTSCSIAAIAWFFRLTGRGNGAILPLSGSSSTNSSPRKRQPRSASSADKVDLPAPDRPVITTARPWRDTALACSSRCRRQPSAICRFIAISAASSPCSSGHIVCRPADKTETGAYRRQRCRFASR